MASAEFSPEVTQVVKESEVVLTLSEDEALFLAASLGMHGGVADNTARKHADAIASALRALSVIPTSAFDNPFITQYRVIGGEYGRIEWLDPMSGERGQWADYVENIHDQRER